MPANMSAYGFGFALLVNFVTCLCLMKLVKTVDELSPS
jgi:hypothetical protein